MSLLFQPTIVEPLIAASIVFVGIENLVRRQLAKRWLVTFGFGLIHGLGFASILRELGIGSMGMRGAIPLLSFNLGVELAQISIAALVLPLIWKLQQRPAFMLRHVPALSLLITLPAFIGSLFAPLYNAGAATEGRPYSYFHSVHQLLAVETRVVTTLESVPVVFRKVTEAGVFEVVRPLRIEAAFMTRIICAGFQPVVIT